MSNVVDFRPSLDRENAMTQAELEAMASRLASAQIEELDTPTIERMLTLGQYLTDRCLAEYERRGALRFTAGEPELPYLSDHCVPSVLTRSLLLGGNPASLAHRPLRASARSVMLHLIGKPGQGRVMRQRMGHITDEQRADEIAKLVGKARRTSKDSAEVIGLMIIFGALGYFALANIPSAILSGLLAGLIKGTNSAVLKEIWQSEIRAILRTYEGDMETVDRAMETEKAING